MRRFLILVVAVAVVWMGVAPPAHAQEPVPSPDPTADVPELAATEQTAQRAEPAVAVAQPVRPRRSLAWTTTLLAVDAVTVSVQALDADATFRVLDTPGGRINNPLVGTLAKNRPAYVAIKMGVAAGIIYSTHRMAKRNRVAAIATALAVNGVYAYFVHQNYRVANESSRK
jgi:hypothetical protein